MEPEVKEVEEKRAWHTPELRKNTVRDTTHMEGDDPFDLGFISPTPTS